ncbi:unnamed protein product [Closterium sp. Naga37s-1]|nr:unnamed protein product [Closterium sp. Naga37s-1]
MADSRGQRLADADVDMLDNVQVDQPNLQGDADVSLSNGHDPEIVKSEEDKKAYRMVTLPNGLITLLIYDPEIAASGDDDEDDEEEEDEEDEIESEESDEEMSVAEGGGSGDGQKSSGRGKGGKGEKGGKGGKSKGRKGASKGGKGGDDIEGEDSDWETASEEEEEGVGDDAGTDKTEEERETAKVAEGKGDGHNKEGKMGQAGGETTGGEGKLAAAAMCVGVGSFLDPPDALGLAHFLEHMLFMGSVKFPDENEYDSFLRRHGGGSNAFTETEFTCYHFDIAHKYLHPALDRFAQFFVAPLVKADAMEREVQAVDSEFNVSLQSDVCRVQQLQCSTLQSDVCRVQQLQCSTCVQPDHPFRKFSWGNRKSLIDDPAKLGVDMRERLLQLYSRFYTAGAMRLVVVGGGECWCLRAGCGAVWCGCAACSRFRYLGMRERLLQVLLGQPQEPHRRPCQARSGHAGAAAAALLAVLYSRGDEAGRGIWACGSGCCKFSWGNRKSLIDDPAKLGVDMRERLLQLYSRFYTAGAMRLVVVGGGIWACGSGCCKFSWGNRKSLIDDPAKLGVDMRERLLQLYSRFYTAGAMRLVVVGGGAGVDIRERLLLVVLYGRGDAAGRGTGTCYESTQNSGSGHASAATAALPAVLHGWGHEAGGGGGEPLDTLEAWVRQLFSPITSPAPQEPLDTLEAWVRQLFSPIPPSLDTQEPNSFRSPSHTTYPLPQSHWTHSTRGALGHAGSMGEAALLAHPSISGATVLKQYPQFPPSPSEPLDTLESWVRQLFSPIPPGGSGIHPLLHQLPPPATFSPPSQDSEMLGPGAAGLEQEEGGAGEVVGGGRLYEVASVKEQQQVSLMWTLPCLHAESGQEGGMGGGHGRGAWEGGMGGGHGRGAWEGGMGGGHGRGAWEGGMGGGHGRGAWEGGMGGGVWEGGMGGGVWEGGYGRGGRSLRCLRPCMRSGQASKPHNYLSHLIGHEGSGSLLSLLKAKGRATELALLPPSLPHHPLLFLPHSHSSPSTEGSGSLLSLLKAKGRATELALLPPSLPHHPLLFLPHSHSSPSTEGSGSLLSLLKAKGWATELALLPPSLPHHPLLFLPHSHSSPSTEGSGSLLSLLKAKGWATELALLPPSSPCSSLTTHTPLLIPHVPLPEGSGSLLSLLKAKGWATELAAGVGESGYEKSSLAFVFTVTITLSEDGLKHALDVVGTVFQYITMLRQAPPQRWVFEELQAIAAMDLRFAEEDSPDEYAVRLAGNMFYYPKRHVIAGDYIHDKWDPDRIAYLLSLLSPHSVRLDLLTHSFDHTREGVLKEPWFDVPYTTTLLSPALLDQWASDTWLNPDLRMPPPNEFIPTDFSLRPSSSSSTAAPTATTTATTTIAAATSAAAATTNISESPNGTTPSVASAPSVPRVVREEAGRCKVWYKQDDVFRSPRLNAHFALSSPHACDSPRSAALTELAVKLIEDSLNETLYLDDVFRSPRLNTHFALSSPHACDSPRSAALTELAVKLIEDSLNETLYLVSVAKLDTFMAVQGFKILTLNPLPFFPPSLSPPPPPLVQASVAKLDTVMAVQGFKIEIRITGFSHKLPTLAARIFRHISTFRAAADRFSALKEERCRAYRNALLKPLKHSAYLRLLLLRNPAWTIPDKLSALTACEVDDLNAFLPTLFSRVSFVRGYTILIGFCSLLLLRTPAWTIPDKLSALSACEVDDLNEFLRVQFSRTCIEMLIHGNATEEDALALASAVTDTLPVPSPPLLDLPSERCLQLPRGKSLLVESPVGNPAEENSAVEVYYQACQVYYQACQDQGRASIRDRSLVDLMEQVMSEPLFDTLRSKEQLGYRVDCATRLTQGLLPLTHPTIASVPHPSSLSCAPLSLLSPVAQVMSEPLFDTLRTKEQLGYRVDCGTRLTHGVFGFCIRVQSADYGPEYLQQRVDLFLKTFRDNLSALPEADFRAHRAALQGAQGSAAGAEDAPSHSHLLLLFPSLTLSFSLSQSALPETDFRAHRAALQVLKMRKDHTLGDETHRYWEQIWEGSSLFNSRQLEAVALYNITLACWAELRDWLEAVALCNITLAELCAWFDRHISMTAGADSDGGDGADKDSIMVENGEAGAAEAGNGEAYKGDGDGGGKVLGRRVLVHVWGAGKWKERSEVSTGETGKDAVGKAENAGKNGKGGGEGDGKDGQWREGQVVVEVADIEKEKASLELFPVLKPVVVAA